MAQITLKFPKSLSNQLKLTGLREYLKFLYLECIVAALKS